jgi:radical SAM/Cys-rich protein
MNENAAVLFQPVDKNLFASKLLEHGRTLTRSNLETLQVNVGRKCNQACSHCHVAASPLRTEMMNASTARRVVEWIERHQPLTVDITGGAPELNEHFRFLVESSRRTGCHVIDRCNLTIIEERGFEDLPDYLASQQVEIVASLPCYSAGNVNKQRGNGVFERSIEALRTLNAIGYGEALSLNLVYNPLGASLPGPQEELEQEYREALLRDFGITFNRLYTITNQPIARFADYLRRTNRWDEYIHLLTDRFNPSTIEGLMCRSTISVGYLGEIYDCDFNQMLGKVIQNGKPYYLWDVTPAQLQSFGIQTDVHCLACTAGCGSSCTGSLD